MKLQVTAAVLCVFIAACGSSSPTQGPSEGTSPLVAEPSPAEASETPAPTETSQPPPALPLRITKVTRKVAPGGNASVSIKTKKGARCTIEVQYDSGPATASGLGAKRAGNGGSVTWNWVVGSTTKNGTYPIAVSCKEGERVGNETTRFAVR